MAEPRLEGQPPSLADGRLSPPRCSALERFITASRALTRAAANLSSESHIAEVAVGAIAATLKVPEVVLWLATQPGRTPHRAATFGDDKLAGGLPDDVVAGPFPRLGAHPPQVAVALCSGDQVFGVLAVLRRRKLFTRSELQMVYGLADIVATRLAYVRTIGLEARNERRHADEQLRSTYEAIACGVTVWAPNGALLQFNHVAEELMGTPLAPLLGKPLMESVRVVRDDGSEAPMHERRVLTAARTGEAIRDYYSTVTRLSDGQPRFLQMNAVPVFDRDGSVSRVVCSFFDITERKEAEEMLAHQAQHDPLTGLGNRILLIDRLQRAIELAARTHGSVALLMIDLNGFKNVNDTRGHHVGDELLRGVASRWRETLRPSDTLARLGGDEFSVLLSESGDEAARTVAGKLRQALESPFRLDEIPLRVAASIGYAVFPREGTNADQLLQHADAAMYRDKRSQRTYSARKHSAAPTATAPAEPLDVNS